MQQFYNRLPVLIVPSRSCSTDGWLWRITLSPLKDENIFPSAIIDFLVERPTIYSLFFCHRIIVSFKRLRDDKANFPTDRAFQRNQFSVLLNSTPFRYLRRDNRDCVNEKMFFRRFALNFVSPYAYRESGEREWNRSGCKLIFTLGVVPRKVGNHV